MLAGPNGHKSSGKIWKPQFGSLAWTCPICRGCPCRISEKVVEPGAVALVEHPLRKVSHSRRIIVVPLLVRQETASVHNRRPRTLGDSLLRSRLFLLRRRLFLLPQNTSSCGTGQPGSFVALSSVVAFNVAKLRVRVAVPSVIGVRTTPFPRRTRFH